MKSNIEPFGHRILHHESLFAMSDTAFRQLLPMIQAHRPGAIWLADENALGCAAFIQPQRQGLSILTNRFDVNARMVAAGFESHFSDFSITEDRHATHSQVFYRISKEKPLAHHLINLAFKLLEQGGELIICGEKSEGIKSYFDKAKRLFLSDATLEKNGKVYLAALIKAESRSVEQSESVAWLDDGGYHRLRAIGQQKGMTFYSKPGVFGWDKIDQGSAFLIEKLPVFMESFKRAPNSLLDLGCGYGYLTAMSAAIPLARRVATDNNAAALSAASYNFQMLNLTVEVDADDCGASLVEPFDMILCNPPFHQGFRIDGGLTEKFLCNSRRLLSPLGAALFVVNRFIPLERKAKNYFPQVDVLAENKSFRLIRLAGR